MGHLRQSRSLDILQACGLSIPQQSLAFIDYSEDLLPKLADGIDRQKVASKNEFRQLTLSFVHQQAGHLIRRSHQISSAIWLEEFDGVTLTSIQYGALVVIRNNPGIDQRTLVDLIAIDRSTIGSMLAILEDNRYIRRSTPQDNRRVKQLFVTTKGEQLLVSNIDRIHRVQQRLLAPLNKKEAAIFMRLLTRLVDVNNKHSRAPLRLSTKKATSTAA